mgnify:CR=1 FL=1
MGDLGGSQETWVTLWVQSRDMGDLGGSQETWVTLGAVKRHG